MCDFTFKLCLDGVKVYQHVFMTWYISKSSNYRAMLCIRSTSHGPVSVCLCLCLSQVRVLLKRLNVGSHKQHHTIARGLYFFDAKDLHEIRPGSPPTRAPNAGGVGQNRRLSTNDRYISKTVKDRHIVSIKVK